MRIVLQLAAALLLTASLAPAQVYTQPTAAKPEKPDKKQKPQRENLEWMWQYSPSDEEKDGNENELVQDLRFQPMLERNFTAPQTFWGTPINGRYRSLASTALDFLSVPDKVLADDQRYLAISGCVVHFCPSRGLLWVDLNAKQPTMIFSAIQWIQESKATTEPAAEYTLWIFPNQPLSPTVGGTQAIPPAYTRALDRWSRQPLAGSGIVQNITHAILVDPDGTPHEVPIATLGLNHTTP